MPRSLDPRDDVTRDPLDGYQARSWKTYPISMEEGQRLPTIGAHGEFLGCLLDSPLTAGIAQQDSYLPERMIFFDYEQMGAGHTVYGTGSIMRLTETYEGHPADRLCFVSYEGLEQEPPTYMLYIEV